MQRPDTIEIHFSKTIIQIRIQSEGVETVVTRSVSLNTKQEHMLRAAEWAAAQIVTDLELVQS